MALDHLLAFPAGPIVEIAVKLGALIVVLVFASFIYAMWQPKMLVATMHSGGHRLQAHPAALQKKRSRAKRTKKARSAGLSKATVVLSGEDDALEEGLEFITGQAGSILAAKLEAKCKEESPSMPRNAKDTMSDGKAESIKQVIAGKTDGSSKRHDKQLEFVALAFTSNHNAPTTYATGPVDDPMQEQGVARDQILKPDESQELNCGKISHHATMKSETCVAPHMPTFGCADHRKYTSSLLLLHRELHLLAARGPPGLPKPADIISPVTASLRCVRV